MANDASIHKIEKISSVSLLSRIEAILYLKGRPVSILELKELTQENHSAVEQALLALMAGYAQRDTALDIEENNGCYSLQLRTGLGELVQNLLPVDISLLPENLSSRP